MITKSKRSFSLSSSLLEELTSRTKGGNISQFVEKALIHYLNELKKKERGWRDIQIIHANAQRFNKEAEENLQFQGMP